MPLPKPRVAALRKLYHPHHPNQMLDQALILLFEKPHSFTGQDLIELQCHGSRAVIQGLLEVLPSSLTENTSDVITNSGNTQQDYSSAVRMAEPGEFTQRAFANGKLDLVQVEALADILSADTSSQLQQALQQLDGRLSEVYDSWREQLISGLAHAEAVIDFGDDERLGVDDLLDDDSAQWNVWGTVTTRMEGLAKSMKRHLADDRRGEIVRQGVQIAIVGPPNAGKSSLFNVLARQDAAIVSPIAGTTRDVLTISLDLGGVKCTLKDTAGVRNATEDSLEWEGIQRARQVAHQADLIVAMVDATDVSRGMETVQSVLNDRNEFESKQFLLVFNKLDLLNNKSYHHNDHILRFEQTFEISCLTQEGIDTLLEALTRKVVDRTQSLNDGDPASSYEGALITRARHRQHVQAATEALDRFHVLSQQGTLAVDMAAEELRLAASELGRITGAVDVEDILDVLFRDFCIGK